MDRRDFLSTSIAAGSFALANYQPSLAALADLPTKRVGVIGTGWYGKCDLFRLLQVAPVEVVSLCDVDSKMLADAADMVQAKQNSSNRPRVFGDYRKMLSEKDHDIVLIATPDHWHALPMILLEDEIHIPPTRSSDAGTSKRRSHCTMHPTPYLICF